MTPRLSDVADHAGVSPATVSRVLNGKNGVAAATRQLVLASAQEVGYEIARPASKMTTGVIGVVVPELQNPIFAAFAQQLANLLTQRGYKPMLGTQTATGISEDEWIEILVDQGAAGIIFVSGMHADTKASTTRYRRLRERQLPVVLINGYVEGLDVPGISDDDRVAMQLAVDHLTSLGHDKIGLAVGPDRYTPVIRKVKGFQEAIRNISDPLGQPIEWSLFTIEGGHAAARQLLKRGATAIVCGSDLMALGAIRACRSIGLSVPDDVSIVGYDDSSLVAFTNPPLTTIRQSVSAMSTAAVRMLLDEISDSPVPRQEYLFRPELIVRGSTAAAHPARTTSVLPGDR